MGDTLSLAKFAGRVRAGIAKRRASPALAEDARSIEVMNLSSIERPWYLDNPRKRSVYVAQAGEHIKIGLSHAPSKGCAELKATLLKSWKCQDAPRIERALH